MKAALLERLWRGWSLHTWPGTAEYDRPDDSKVGTHAPNREQCTHNKTQANCIYTFASASLFSLSLFLPPSQFCAQPVQSRGAFCQNLSEGGTERSLRVIEGNRKRMVVDVRLENKGENAYNARLNMTYTPNLRFSSLIVKVHYHYPNSWFLWWEHIYSSMWWDKS